MVDHSYFPDFLRELANPPKKPASRVPVPIVVPSEITERQRRYSDAVLRHEVESLAATAEGSRDDNTNKSAFRVGRYVGGGFLARGRAEAEMLNACVTNGLVADNGKDKVLDTIRRGMEAGMKHPLSPPDDERSTTSLNGPPDDGVPFSTPDQFVGDDSQDHDVAAVNGEGAPLERVIESKMPDHAAEIVPLSAYVASLNGNGHGDHFRGFRGDFPEDQIDAGLGDLVPLNDPKMPRLTPEMIDGDGWVGEFIGELSKETETPLELPATVCLATLHAAVARNFKVLVNTNHFETCNQWMMGIFPPGTRKSSIFTRCAKPLTEWEREKADELAPQIADVNLERELIQRRIKKLKADVKKAEDLEAIRAAKEQIKQLEAAMPPEIVAPRLWTSDATHEKLGSLMADNDGCIAWMTAESTFFEIAAGRYSKGGGDTNLSSLLGMHPGDPMVVDRMGRETVRVLEPLLTICQTPQPDVIVGLGSTKGFKGRGLLGRFLYFAPYVSFAGRTHENSPMPKRVEVTYHNNICKILDMPPGKDAKGRPCKHILKLSPEAVAERRKFATSLDPMMDPEGRFAAMSDWASKAAGAAARLAGALHVAKHVDDQPWDHEISVETMRLATDIVALSGEHAIRAYGLIGEDPTLNAAKQAWAWVERHRLLTFKEQDMWQALKNTLNFPRAEDVKAALSVLVERGYVTIDEPAPQRKRGRPAGAIVRVTPEASEGWS